MSERLKKDVRIDKVYQTMEVKKGKRKKIERNISRRKRREMEGWEKSGEARGIEPRIE